MNARNVSRLCLALALGFAVTALALPANAASITIVNADGANEGYNDPSPRAPIGGNTGTTLGQQRLNVAQHAADIWGALLPSDAPILIISAFNPQPCTATAATLASAGATQVFRNSPNVEIPNVWYHVALANKLAGFDQSPTAVDGQVVFNIDVDNPVCLGARNFYYGFDNNNGGHSDMLTTALHEIGHALGFANFVNETSGTLLSGGDDIFNFYTFDVATNKFWNQMTNAERVASAINTNNVVWTGRHANEAAPGVLLPGTPLLNVPGLGASFRIGTAQFGGPLGSPGVTAQLVVALDPADVAGPTTLDGCSPFTNAAAVAGNIALVNRGTCTFVVKAANAQAAGAVALVVHDNVVDTPPPQLGGADPTITIPAVRVGLANGNAIKAALPLSATLGLDASVLQGTQPETGLMLLNAPNPLQQGSSISHWDPIASANLTMEPAINDDLTTDVDLTLEQFVDIGWFSDFDGVPDGIDACIGSDQSATVVIDGCDSGVANTVFTDGCRISDGIEGCADGAGNHGGFVSCVSHFTNALKKAGDISGSQKGDIQSCAGQANIP